MGDCGWSHNARLSPSRIAGIRSWIGTIVEFAAVVKFREGG
jgi:hypothetical protein